MKSCEHALYNFEENGEDDAERKGTKALGTLAIDAKKRDSITCMTDFIYIIQSGLNRFLGKNKTSTLFVKVAQYIFFFGSYPTFSFGRLASFPDSD